MIEKQDVIDFFDRAAAQWDAEMIRSDEIIGLILDHAGIGPGQDVLDVACGTGVLIPDYLARDAASVTGIDISPEMARIAREKFSQEKVRILCGDVEELDAEQLFDAVVVYNAFPHFPDPERLIGKLSSLLKPGGRLTVAHGMSRAMIDHRHDGPPSKVSVGLMHEDALADLFSRYLTVTVKCSDDRMYQVVGVKQ